MIEGAFNVAHVGLGPVELSSHIVCRIWMGTVFHKPWSSCMFNDRLIPKEMPLQLCKSITIHKGQQLTVDEGQQFNACLAYLPEGRNRNSPGLELVSCLRVKAEENFALGCDLNELSRA